MLIDDSKGLERQLKNPEIITAFQHGQILNTKPVFDCEQWNSRKGQSLQGRVKKLQETISFVHLFIGWLLQPSITETSNEWGTYLDFKKCILLFTFWVIFVMIRWVLIFDLRSYYQIHAVFLKDLYFPILSGGQIKNAPTFEF